MKSVNYTLLFALLIGFFGQSLLGAAAGPTGDSAEGDSPEGQSMYTLVWCRIGNEKEFVCAKDKNNIFYEVSVDDGKYSLGSKMTKFCPELHWPALRFIKVPINAGMLQIPVYRNGTFSVCEDFARDRIYDIDQCEIINNRDYDATPLLFVGSGRDIYRYAQHCFSVNDQKFHLFFTRDKQVYFLRESSIASECGWYKLDCKKFELIRENNFNPVDKIISVYIHSNQDLLTNAVQVTLQEGANAFTFELALTVKEVKSEGVYLSKKFYLFDFIEVPWKYVRLCAGQKAPSKTINKSVLYSDLCCLKEDENGNLFVDTTKAVLESIVANIVSLMLPFKIVSNDFENPALVTRLLKEYSVFARMFRRDKPDCVSLPIAFDEHNNLIFSNPFVEMLLVLRNRNVPLLHLKKVNHSSLKYTWLKYTNVVPLTKELTEIVPEYVYVPVEDSVLMQYLSLFDLAIVPESEISSIPQNIVDLAAELVESGNAPQFTARDLSDVSFASLKDHIIEKSNHSKTLTKPGTNATDTSVAKKKVENSYSKAGVAATAFAGIAGATGVAGVITKALALHSLSHKIKRAVSNGESATAFKEKRSGLIKQLLGFGTVGLVGIIAAGAMIKKGIHLAAA